MKLVATHEITQTTKGGIPSLFDEDGFLMFPEIWDHDLTNELAMAEGIEKLSYEHWKIIHFLRDYYFQFGAVPLMRRVCRSQQLNKIQAKRLFSDCQSAWRIAGLPHPGEEAKTYMG